MSDPNSSRQLLRTLRRDRRAAILGVAFVSVGFLAVTGLAMLMLPWVGTGDSYDHLDYVYQVTLGHLPAPLGHQWRPGDYPGEGATGRQFASAHPPFYYFLMSLLAGQQLLSNHWHVAIEMIRLANTVFGLIGVVSMGFFGWMIGGRFRVRLAIALPAVASATFSYLRFSSDVYNDLLVTALSIVALTLATRVLQRGPSWRLTPFIAVIGAMAFGTKATYILTLGVVCVALVAGALAHPAGRSVARSIGRGLAHAAVVVAAPLAAFGWFFLRNIGKSGSWYRSIEQGEIGDRADKSVLDNLTNWQFWTIVPSRSLVGRGPASFYDTATILSSAIFVAAFALTVVVAVIAIRRRAFRWTTVRVLIVIMVLGQVAEHHDDDQHAHGGPAERAAADRWTTVRVLIVIMVLGHLAGSYAVQLSHATGYGAYSPRYFLPSTLSIGMLLVVGVVGLPRRAGAIATAVLVAALWVSNTWSMLVYSLKRSGVVSTGLGPVKDSGALAFANGFPGWSTAVLMAVAALALVGMAAVLWRHRVADSDVQAA